MAQDTAFGKATLTTYMKVEKKDGRVIYYKVVDDENIELTEQEYLAETRSK